MIRPAAFFLVTTWLSFAAVARGQDEPAGQPVNLPPSGSQLFRALLDFAGVSPVDNQTMSRPALISKTIVIVYGAPKNAILAKMVQDEVRHVLLRGGNVLIATDKEIVLADYLPNNAGDAYLLSADVRDPIKCLPGYPECPFVSPGLALNLEGPVTPEQNPFAGLNKVATNRPGAIFVSRGRPVPRLAYFHEGTTVHPHKNVNQTQSIQPGLRSRARPRLSESLAMDGNGR